MVHGGRQPLAHGAAKHELCGLAAPALSIWNGEHELDHAPVKKRMALVDPELGGRTFGGFEQPGSPARAECAPDIAPAEIPRRVRRHRRPDAIGQRDALRERIRNPARKRRKPSHSPREGPHRRPQRLRNQRTHAEGEQLGKGQLPETRRSSLI